MELEIKERILEDIDELDEDIKKWIFDELKELENKPVNHKDSKLIRIKDNNILRYRMKAQNKADKNFKAIYRILKDEIRIVSILCRDYS